jgi:hypothetical protein
LSVRAGENAFHVSSGFGGMHSACRSYCRAGTFEDQIPWVTLKPSGNELRRFVEAAGARMLTNPPGDLRGFILSSVVDAFTRFLNLASKLLAPGDSRVNFKRLSQPVARIAKIILRD